MLEHAILDAEMEIETVKEKRNINDTRMPAMPRLKVIDVGGCLQRQ